MCAIPIAAKAWKVTFMVCSVGLVRAGHPQRYSATIVWGIGHRAGMPRDFQGVLCAPGYLTRLAGSGGDEFARVRAYNRPSSLRANQAPCHFLAGQVS
jgi:hypothetical protein